VRDLTYLAEPQSAVGSTAALSEYRASEFTLVTVDFVDGNLIKTNKPPMSEGSRRIIFGGFFLGRNLVATCAFG
jgi:hypothetical protein